MIVVFPDYTHFLLKSENEQEAACTGGNEQETIHSQILAYL